MKGVGLDDSAACSGSWESGDGSTDRAISWCGSFTSDGTGGRCMAGGACMQVNVAAGADIAVDSELASAGSCGAVDPDNKCTADRAVDGITDMIHNRWLSTADAATHWAVNPSLISARSTS